MESGLARDHNVEVINPFYCDLIIEKKNPEIFYESRKIEKVDAVIPRFGVSDTFYGTALVRQFELMKVLQQPNHRL